MKLFQVSIKFLNTVELRNGVVDENTTKQWWTQISKHASLKDLKTRIHDILIAGGFNIELADLRLWLNNPDDFTDEASSLEDRCKSVQEGFKTAI